MIPLIFTTSLGVSHLEIFIVLLRIVIDIIKRASFKTNLDLTGLVLNNNSEDSER
jgi:hypothetical protein